MSAQDGAARYVMQRVDHAAIFILIAAIFTPMHAILFRVRLGQGSRRASCFRNAHAPEGMAGRAPLRLTPQGVSCARISPALFPDE